MTPGRGPNIEPLSIRDTVDAGRHTLALSGELDLGSANELEQAVREVCASGAELVLDLREVTFMDSTGLRVLIVAGALCEENGHELRIVPGEDIQRILEMTGLDRVCRSRRDDARAKPLHGRRSVAWLAPRLPTARVLSRSPRIRAFR
jgi:anti-anti-sigma factor